MLPETNMDVLFWMHWVSSIVLNFIGAVIFASVGRRSVLQQVMAQTDEAIAVKILLEALLTSIAVEFDVDVADLCSPSRKRSLAEARGVAAWLVSETEQHTLA